MVMTLHTNADASNEQYFDLYFYSTSNLHFYELTNIIQIVTFKSLSIMEYVAQKNLLQT